MEQSFLKQMSGFLRDKKNRKRYIAVFLCLALVVSLTTFVSLTMSGNAQNHTVKVLDCKYEAHKHTADCYDKEHPDQLICGYADYAVHIHNDDCYDASGVLVCQLPQIEPHTHDETCYTEEKTLTCELPESEGHVHTEACYTTEQGELTCTVEEHTHSEECYDENGEVICGKEEHTHNEACYEQIQTLTCEIPEGEGAHTHTDDCYVTEKKLTCGKLELHTHTEECYQHDENGKLVLANDAELVLDDEGNPVFDEEHQPIVICGIPVLEEHVHGADCFKTVELTDEEVDGFDTPETSEAPAESESCYDAEGNLTCTKEEHTHTEECYDEAAAEIVCGKEEHTHTAPAEVPAEAESCYDAEGNLICTKEEHTHSEECYGEDGALICEKEEHTHTGAGESNEPEELTKTYQDSGVVITATYTEAANIPEEAELIAKAVTSETDPELYAQRMEEALQHVTLPEDAETPNMLLYNIGFYVNGEEVEPAAPVTITVQLLNAEGFAVGAPITVVHFAEDGTEVLDGTALNENSETTFTTDGFSPFALLSTTGEYYGIMPIDNTDPYGSLGPYLNDLDYGGVTYDPLTEEWSTNLSMEFKMPGQDVKAGEFTYKFPEGVQVPDELLGTHRSDPNNTPSWYEYWFTKESDGHYELHVEFTEDAVRGAGNNVTFGFEFSASGHREDDDNRLHFDFSNNQDIEVPAKDLQRKYDLSVTKQGRFNPTDNTLEYDVYVESQSGTNGEDITLQDKLTWEGSAPGGVEFGELEITGVERQYYNGSEWVTDEKVSVGPTTTDEGQFNMTLDPLAPKDIEGKNYPTRYKVTYKYKLNGDIGTAMPKANNTVEVKTDSKGDHFSSTVELKKEMLDKSAWQKDEDTIQWTIDVNKSQADITGYVLTDDFFTSRGITKDNITITPKEGWHWDEAKHGIVFDKIDDQPNTNRYTITYTTKITDEDRKNGITNDVDFTDPTLDNRPDYHDGETLNPDTAETYPPAEKKYTSIEEAEDLLHRVVEWEVSLPVPSDGFPEGTIFIDRIGNTNPQQYMTIRQLQDLINTLNSLGLTSEYIGEWEVICQVYGEHGGNNGEFKKIDPQNSDNPPEGGHKCDENCQIIGWKFKFKKNWTPSPDVLTDNKLTFRYKTFLDLGAEDIFGQDGKVYLKNTFNNFQADYNLYFDRVDKTDGENKQEAEVKVNKDGTLTWKVTIHVNEDHKEIVVKDTFSTADKQSGMKLTQVDFKATGGMEGTGSADPNQLVGTFVNKETNEEVGNVRWTYNSETGEFVVTIDALGTIPKGTVIELTYTCNITDEEYLEQLMDGNFEQRTYDNTVTVLFDSKPTEDTAQQTVVGSTEGLDREGVVNKSGAFNWNTDDPVIDYQVKLNPTGANLLKGETDDATDPDMLEFHDVLKYDRKTQVSGAADKIGPKAKNNDLDFTNGPEMTEEQKEKLENGSGSFGVYYEPYYEMDPTSVKFYKAKLGEDGQLQSTGEELENVTWSLDEKIGADGKTIEKYINAQVPDGTPIIVEYRYKVRVRFFIEFISYSGDPIPSVEVSYNVLKSWGAFDDWGGSEGDLNFRVSNTAHLEGGRDKTIPTDVKWQKATVTTWSYTDGTAIYKVDALNYATYLKDAVFALYDESGDVKVSDITTDSSGKIVVSCEVTNENGKVTLKYKFTGKDTSTFEAEAGKYYFLKEKTPPSGYEIPDKETIVVLWYPGESDTPPSNDDILEKLPVGWPDDGHEYNVKLVRMDNPTTTWVPNEKDDEPEYTLPETGGESTHMYMLGGAMLLLLAAALAYKAKISGRRVFRG